MTFEQKVEKLRGIVDTEIRIWCQTADEDAKFIKIANEVSNQQIYTMDSITKGASYRVDFEYEHAVVNYVGNNCSIIGLDNYVPYSDFFEDKFKDKPLESKSIKDYTIGEIESLCLKCDDCSTCVMYVKDHYCDCIFSIVVGLNPQDWKIDEYFNTIPSLTQSEIDILKAIKVLYPNKTTLTFYRNEGCYGWNGIVGTKDKLSSLDISKEYSIDELLGAN